MCLFDIKQLQFLNFDGLDLKLEETEIVGLSGESGSGKSKLFRALADLDSHQGKVKLNGIEQQQFRAHQWREKVALLPAETHWWLDTVGEHFNCFSQLNLSALGLDNVCADWSVMRLSSGEKQRLGLLRMLENIPLVLLLDEPTANLDKSNSILFENFIKQYLITHKAGALWVSHDIEQLQRVAQRQYKLESGSLNRVY